MPKASTARTAKVCEPSARPSVRGEVHASKAPPSREHSKVASCSGEENSKVGVLSLISEPSAGPESIVVSVGVVSTEKVRVAGVASGFP